MTDVRDELAKGLERKLDGNQIKQLIDEILTMQKRVWTDIRCPDCGKKERMLIPIPDARAICTALGDLLNQGFGRPSNVDVETKVIVNRTVHYVSE